MKHGSLFSGIGGFDLASEWMGWENVFHCEWMEFPRKVLEYHFPNADSLIDICKTDFKKYEGTIDIISGGFPCQPFSLAGKRKGTDDERYLWGEMLRAVQEIKPKFVIAENVFGITNIDGGLVFEQVCLDLETEGYEVQPFIIPAAAKNAPHRRDRCWFIGVRNDTNTNGNGFQQRNGNDEINASQGGQYALGDIDESIVNGNTSNTERKGLEGHNRQREKRSINRSDEGLFIGAKTEFITTNTDSCRQQTLNNEKRILGQEDRAKTFSGNSSKSIYREEGWQNFPTQSPICSGDDGLPTELDGITFSKWRAESIKGYGNAIVPQVAFEIFKVIEKINCNLSK
jgi:DNA (cytosine-5)-methyltransferase 1